MSGPQANTTNVFAMLSVVAFATKGSFPLFQRTREFIPNILKRTHSDNSDAYSRLRPHTCAPRNPTITAAMLRLVQFEESGRRRVGVQRENGGSVVDITAVNPSIPTDMKSFIENWDTNLSLALR